MLYQCESCIDASQVKLLLFGQQIGGHIRDLLEHAECRVPAEHHK